VGIPGGSINIGLVGTAPKIPNPLEYWQDRQHDLILSFLFRGLIHYSHEQKRYEWELAQCDLTDLSEVKCTLTGSANWSDGTPIQTDDVVATFQAFKDNPPNEKMKAFLSKVAVVTREGGVIELSADEKNSLMLDLLTYPILRSDIIERIRTDRLGPDGYVTSWAYAFTEKEKNTQYGYDRITIGKNTKNNDTSWLDKYNFLFFPDADSLERAKDILSIIVPPTASAPMILGPRYDSYEYSMQEYIGLFLNTDRLSNTLRKHILLQAESGFSGVTVADERSALDLFPIGKIKLEKNLADVMKDLGYRKVDDELARLATLTGTISTGITLSFPKNTYIDIPSKESVFFSEEVDGEITIAGNVPIGTKSVSINGYSLKEFSTGNPRFLYKVNTASGTLIEGKNTYTLEFESANGTKITRDTLTVYYSRDGVELRKIKKTLEDEELLRQNTPEKIAERNAKIASEKEKLQALNPRFYYNSKLEPYKLKLLYLSDPPSISTYATKLTEALKSLWLEIEITEISSKDFGALIQKGEKNYDMLIIGFEATGRFSRIGQIFLSSEAAKGINFAKIESKSLDALFGSLRTADTEEKTKDIMKKIGDFMTGEAFFLPISSPLHTIHIDKNLKWIKVIPTFQDITTLSDVTKKASIKEEYHLSLKDKSIGGFFSWFWKKLRFEG
jgi:ABC-type oligopeptide transport system substrate-binding subunit